MAAEVAVIGAACPSGHREGARRCRPEAQSGNQRRERTASRADKEDEYLASRCEACPDHRPDVNRCRLPDRSPTLQVHTPDEGICRPVCAQTSSA